MTQLSIFAQDDASSPLFRSDSFASIQARLQAVGIPLERWDTPSKLDAAAGPEEILQAYQADIDKLVRRGGYQSWDVVSMQPDHPDKTAFREKFLHEHTHAEDELRYFVRGSGLFTLHIDDRVYNLLCTQGDLINVPAGTRHWFDMGPNPEFTAIRLFNNPSGWVAQFTGSTIAENFPRLEN